MSAIQVWLAREDAEEAERRASWPTRWFAYRAILGLVILAKAGHTAFGATGAGGYVLSALLATGGLYWIFEGVQGLRGRLRIKEPTPTTAR